MKLELERAVSSSRRLPPTVTTVRPVTWKVEARWFSPSTGWITPSQTLCSRRPACTCSTTADAMEELLDEEEEEEEEDDEEEEEEEEEEENEDDEEDEDSSSVCSGLSDSSTQSLANSNSEDDEEDDEDEEKSGSLQGDMAASPVSHTEVVSLSSVLCYSDGSVVHDNHVSGHAFLMNSSPTEYYQLGNAATVSSGPQPVKGFGEVLAFQDPISATNGSATQGTFGLSAEQYTNYSNQAEEHYPSRSSLHSERQRSRQHADLLRIGPGEGAGEQPDNQTQTQFENYLNNNTASPYSSHGSRVAAEQPPQEPDAARHSDLSLLANANLPLPDHCPEVTAI
ncbi:cysteine/serine-rich nuclear protein 3-like [Takifugu rubripes]|nr:cysteine/serine-rich nuclear protein 3-like [Takifugu rubripes]